MGRSTEYTQEIADAAWDYIESYADHDHAFPSVVGLCKVLKRGKSTIYDWAKDSDKEFSDILGAINECQELIAWNKGLKGEYNANLVKLLLGKHGYHDKQDTDITGGLVLSHEQWVDELEE